MKRTKRIVAMMMVVVLMLALSMSAFANGSVTLYTNVYHNDGSSTETYIGSYNIGNNSTVYDILSPLTTTWSSESNAVTAYSPLCDINSPLDNKYSQKIIYMRSFNGISSSPHIPTAGALDEDDYYDHDQTVDAVLIAADAALADYGGLDYWLGNGYGIAEDWEHMVYIGWDWKFTVNGSEPGISIDPSVHPYDGFFGYTMRESLLGNADRIDLNYVYSFMVF